MLFRNILFFAFVLQFSFITNVNAGDFDWLESLSLEAKEDGSGFNARLATRFKLGEVKVKAVIGDVGSGANAYMVMRLGEISGQNIDVVAEKYKANKGKGWGRLAKSLGIKPGSQAFRALKSGHDLSGSQQGSGRGKGKKNKQNKNKGKGNKHKW